MTASVTIHLYQPDQSLYKAISETENLPELLTKWFGDSWVDDESEDAIFNACTLQTNEGVIIFTFEVCWFKDEKTLFTLVRNLPVELTYTNIFYDQAGEYSKKWSISGKNVSKKTFESHMLSNTPTIALQYALHEENINIFKAALPTDWGKIIIEEETLLEYCWRLELYSLSKYLIKNINTNCAIDYSRQSLLANIIRHGSVKLISQFIDFGANPLFVDSEENNALHLWAKYNPDESLLLTLIQHGVPVNAKNIDGFTPLQSLLIEGMVDHDDIESRIQILYKAGADLSITDPDGASLLWHTNNNDLKDFLHSVGVIFSRPYNAYENGNPLEIAIEHNDDEMFIYHLHPEHFKNNNELLFSAYAHKRHDWFRLLLEHGISPNMCLKNSHCSLFDILLSDKEYDLARLLIAHGVDVNGKPNDYQGYLRIFWAIGDGEDETVQLYREARCDPSAMLVCLAYSRIPAEKAEVLFKQLLSDGADVNRHFQQDSRLKFGEIMGHVTPLYAAIKRSDVTMVRLLLEHGANPSFSAPPAICAPMKYVDNLIRFEPGKDENKIIRDLLLAHGA